MPKSSGYATDGFQPTGSCWHGASDTETNEIRTVLVIFQLHVNSERGAVVFTASTCSVDLMFQLFKKRSIPSISKHDIRLRGHCPYLISPSYPPYPMSYFPHNGPEFH